jgi:hypothetical protein
VDLTSSASRSDGGTAGVPWSLAGTRAVRLASRLVAAALGIGVVGGMVMACLFVVFKAAGSTVTTALAIGLPLVLTTMIGWRLATGSSRRLGWIAGTGVLVLVLVQGFPHAGEFVGDIAHNAGVTLVAVLGGILGIAPALAAVVVLVPVLLALRSARAPISLTFAQILVTGVAMAVTGAFSLWMELGRVGLVGVAVALGGTGAVITARWSLVDRRA